MIVSFYSNTVLASLLLSLNVKPLERLLIRNKVCNVQVLCFIQRWLLKNWIFEQFGSKRWDL